MRKKNRECYSRVTSEIPLILPILVATGVKAMKENADLKLRILYVMRNSFQIQDIHKLKKKNEHIMI